jgi:hypothetical protein
VGWPRGRFGLDYRHGPGQRETRVRLGSGPAPLSGAGAALESALTPTPSPTRSKEGLRADGGSLIRLAVRRGARQCGAPATR